MDNNDNNNNNSGFTPYIIIPIRKKKTIRKIDQNKSSRKQDIDMKKKKADLCGKSSNKLCTDYYTERTIIIVQVKIIFYCNGYTTKHIPIYYTYTVMKYVFPYLAQ